MTELESARQQIEQLLAINAHLQTANSELAASTEKLAAFNNQLIGQNRELMIVAQSQEPPKVCERPSLPDYEFSLQRDGKQVFLILKDTRQSLIEFNRFYTQKDDGLLTGYFMCWCGCGRDRSRRLTWLPHFLADCDIEQTSDRRIVIHLDKQTLANYKRRLEPIFRKGDIVLYKFGRQSILYRVLDEKVFAGRYFAAIPATKSGSVDRRFRQENKHSIYEELCSLVTAAAAPTYRRPADKGSRSGEV